MVAPQAFSGYLWACAAECGQRVNECGQVAGNAKRFPSACPHDPRHEDIHALSTRSPSLPDLREANCMFLQIHEASLCLSFYFGPTKKA